MNARPAASRPLIVRAVAGVAVAAVVGTGITAAALAPWPTGEREPLSVALSPEASRSVAVCDGPLLALGRDQTAAGAITEAAPSTIVFDGVLDGASDGAGEGVGDGLTVSQLATPDRADEGTAPTVISAEPVANEQVDLAAASVSLLADEDLRGLAVSACTRPAMESWLVGGSGATGAADVILLANPGDVPAQVDLRVFGAEGAVDPVAGQDLVVAAGTQRAIPLAAIARGEETPVVRVTADGAAVRASMQTTITRTLIAGGVDQVAAAANPALRHTIPSVDVTVGPDAVASAGGLTLRMMATASATTADVVVRSVADGSVVSEEPAVDLPAGLPVALTLSGMPIGRYTVTVEATEPLVAAAWTSTDLAAPADFAWATSAPAITAPTLVAVADAPSPRLVVVADGDTTVEVGELSSDGGAGVAGETDSFEVAAGRAVEIPVTAGSVYRIDPGEATVHASVGFSAAGSLGVYAVADSAAAAAELTIYP